jgi:prepilin-type N-terminal cleavage/methylation domain-containing protein
MPSEAAPQRRGHAEGSAAATGEQGFSLVELLVAMTVTLTVLAGAFAVLQEAARASRLAATSSDTNQNLRVAMNAVLRDLIQAGEGDFGLRTGISIPSGAGVDPIVRPGPVGFAWSFPAHYTVLPAVSPGNGTGIVVNGIATDVITILYQDRRLDFSGVIPTIPASGASMTFPVTFAIDDEAIGIKDGDLIRFGNGAMQEVSNVAGNTVHFAAEAPSRLNQRTAPQGSVMAMKNGEPNFPDLAVSRIAMVTYYLRFGTDGVPQLVRRANHGAERVIAVGVENLQMTFDLVDGATNPTNVDTFDADTAEGQIRKVNLYMAGRSREVDVASGHPLRTSLSTQVSLRSLAFVSRYDIAP